MDSILRRLLRLEDRLIDKTPVVLLIYRDGTQQRVKSSEAFITAARSYYSANPVERFEAADKRLEESLNNAYWCMYPKCVNPWGLWSDEIGCAIVPAGFWDKCFPLNFPLREEKMKKESTHIDAEK